VDKEHLTTRHAALVLGLGTAQLLAWGTLYYALAIFGQPMRRELHLSNAELFGGFACSLALSGLLAPLAGRLIDRWGGRKVLATSGAVGACGFVVLAATSTRLGFITSWIVLGLAMALGLYDSCFAALAQATPFKYRANVTGVTLLGGLASTVAWPLSHYLLPAIGWRGACCAYAGALLVCSLIYLAVLPHRLPGIRLPLRAAPHSERVATLALQLRNRARTLSLAFAGSAFVASAFSAHMIYTLKALQIPTERAVWLASTLGIIQVGGRLLERLVGQRHSALALGTTTFGVLALSVWVLLGIVDFPWLVFPFVLLYGAANGLLTIVKAAIPVELLGFDGVGATIGTFSAPSLLSRAAAPVGFVLLADMTGIRGTLTIMLLIAMCSFGALVHAARRQLASRI